MLLILLFRRASTTHRHKIKTKLRPEFDCNNKSRTLHNSSDEKLAGAGDTTGQEEEMTGDCVQIIETNDDDNIKMKMDPLIPVTKHNDGGRDHFEDANNHEATVHADA